MEHTIPAQFSVKYWHDKTVNTQGWWRILPLVGLMAAVVATVVYYLVKVLGSRLQDIKQQQQEDAAERAFRAAVDPTWTEVKPDFSGLWDDIVDGFLEGAGKNGDEEPHCTCISNGNGGHYCAQHGDMYT